MRAADNFPQGVEPSGRVFCRLEGQQMEIYRGKLELLDYVFFATVERGKVYETGAFIHNYALAYALRLAAAPYSHTVQEPHYEEELSPLNEQGIYIDSG